jgi:NitT/TauT family transport system substrate-binding protein
MTGTGVNRRIFSSTAAALLAALAVAPLRAQPRLEKTRLTIAVAAKSAFHMLPLIIAEQLGYFREQGLDLEIGDFAATAADVRSGPYQQVINLQSRGQRFQSFVLLGRTPGLAMGISHKTLPYYRSLATLVGKKIGISATGSTSHLLASSVLIRSGLNPTDVNFAPIGSSAGALAALRSGQIDAICNAEPVITTLEQKGEVRIVADTRSLKGTVEVFGGPMPATCLFAASEFLEKNPNTVQALTSAVVHALKWLQTAGPSDIIKTVPEAYLLGDRALYLAAFDRVRESISPDGLMPVEGPATVLKALTTFDSSVKADRIELIRSYSNEYAKKVKDPFQLRH